MVLGGNPFPFSCFMHAIRSRLLWRTFLYTVALLLADILFIDAQALMSFQDVMAHPHASPTAKHAYGPASEQYGTLWLPQGNGPFAVVIAVHGGCWTLPGLQPSMDYIAEDLRKNGVAVWNVDYRPLGSNGAGYPGSFNDIADAVDYVRTLAQTYKLDSNRVVIIGHSAGGHMALWAAARYKLAPNSPLYRKNPLALTAAISLSGIPDLKDYRDHGPACDQPDTINHLTGANTREATTVFSDTSPSNLLPLNTPQIIVAGDQDSIVPAQFGNSYAHMAKQAGDNVEFISFPHAGHFEMIAPQSDAWQQIKARVLTLLKSPEK